MYIGLAERLRNPRRSSELTWRLKSDSALCGRLVGRSGDLMRSRPKIGWPDDVKSAVWEEYEHNSRPILTEIWNMEDEFPALPHSAIRLGAMLLLSLEHTAFDAAETPDDPADISTKNTLQCIESLSHLLSGSIARDAQDLLSRRDRPIRDLACLVSLRYRGP